MSGYRQPENMPEADWKKFRQIHQTVLERFCQQILAEITQACQKTSESYHERYLNVWRLIEDRDQDIDDIFGELKRSRALQSLAAMRARDLVTAAEYDDLSETTRARADLLSDFFRGAPPKSSQR